MSDQPPPKPKKPRKKYKLRDKVPVSLKITVPVEVPDEVMLPIYEKDPAIARHKATIERQKQLLGGRGQEVEQTIRVIKLKIDAVNRTIEHCWKENKAHRKDIKTAKKLLKGQQETAVIKKMERLIVGRKNYLLEIEGRKLAAAGKLDFLERMKKQPVV